MKKVFVWTPDVEQCMCLSVLKYSWVSIEMCKAEKIRKCTLEALGKGHKCVKRSNCGLQEAGGYNKRTHPCFALLGWWCEHHTIEPIWEELEYHFEEVWFLFQLEKSDKKGVPFEFVSSYILFAFCPLWNKSLRSLNTWTLNKLNNSSNLTYLDEANVL